jgi:hypothetical protein
MENVTTWSTFGLEVVVALVGLLLLTLRQGVTIALDAWAANQSEQKAATRILKLKTVIEDGLATVEANIAAELTKDLRVAMADGVLSDDERKMLREKIAEYARKTLSTDGVAAAREVYSIADEHLDDWLANRVEGRVINFVRG